MRILFLMTLIGENTGVPDKVYTMLTTMEALGHEVAFLPIGFYTTGEQNRFDRYIVKTYKQDDCNLKGFRKIIHYVRILKEYQPDILYYRYDVRVSDWMILLMGNTRYIVEHNAVEYNEFINAGLKGAAIKDKCLGWIVRLFSSGLVSVTREILDYQLSLIPGNKKSAVIANSIDVSAYPVYKKSFGNSKRLVMVSNYENWQGLDRIVDLMGHEKMREFKLVVVGSGVEYDKYSLSDTHGNVEFAGPLFGEDLINVMMSCDVGIGSLATYRKGINEACPLKVRLYIAIGLPVVIGYDDPDLPETVPFVLHVSNSGDRISPDSFIQFYNTISTIPGESIREFAQKQLDTRGKMEKLVRFISTESSA